LERVRRRGFGRFLFKGEQVVNYELASVRPSAGTEHNGSVRVVIAGEHPLLAWALRRVMEDTSDLCTVAEATSADAALNQVFSLKPDVVVVDCSLADGWRLARELRDRHDDLGIVILTADGSDDLLFRALDTGASAYLNKAASVTEVLGAIRHAAVAARSFSASGLAQALRRRNENHDRMSLSPREHQVLALLREGHSVPQVAATIYVSLSTAKTYVARLYEKLGANNRAQALMTAVELGLFDGSHSALAV
jgi:DNA-binding NarL/FixJ family response regulator